MYTKDFSDEEKKEMRNLLRLSDTMLKVSEIFVSIQGEGVSAGVPVVFIRLSLCNLSCKFCDTPYTFNWEGTDFKHDTKSYEQVKYDPRKEIISKTPLEIFDNVCYLAHDNIKRVVITGGEPLMQQKSSAFVRLLSLLRIKGFDIEVETNGTIIPTDQVNEHITQYNVSPKLNNSGNSLKARRKDSAYTFFVIRGAYFKFVVSDYTDLKEIEELCKMYKIPADKVLLMPEGRTTEEITNRSQQIVKLCVDKGYRFCTRLHIHIWDGVKRGV